ncbi:unnamed protein product [Miscanthus lutarioriparius]|uniref:Uncharacterized protein n=1 Tax=Miscanthus lutarioriparius TaxID=422564 RepID=A0A811QQM5_9POAL|nr:unnamed protein product [Miscanthus lutarioriparius]
MAVTTMTIQMSFVPIIQCKFGQIHLRTKNQYHVIPGAQEAARVPLVEVEPWAKVSGFTKVDLASGDLARFDCGEGHFSGEPCFVFVEGARGVDDSTIDS